MKIPLLIIFASIFVTHSLSAQTLQNGSFEANSFSISQYPLGSGLGDEHAALITEAPGWRIDRRTYWVDNTGGFTGYQTVNVGSGNHPYYTQRAQDGNNFLDIYNTSINETTVVDVMGSFSGLTAGNTYEVSFWYSAFSPTNPYPTQSDWIVSVLDSGGFAYSPAIAYNAFTGTTFVDSYLYPNDGKEGLVSPWKKGTYQFTSNETTAMLKFVGIGQGGPLQMFLDNVSITQVPEPSLTILFGIGTCALTLRRRRH